jgi:hypothetical protein
MKEKKTVADSLCPRTERRSSQLRAIQLRRPLFWRRLHARRTAEKKSRFRVFFFMHAFFPFCLFFYFLSYSP